jgi:LysM repeat protein
VVKWRAYYTNREAIPPTNTLVASANPVRQPANTPTPPSQQQIQTNRQPVVRAAAKTYRVQSGDTPSSIARKHNVKLDFLMSANPGLDPRRMQVGQVLKIPAP